MTTSTRSLLDVKKVIGTIIKVFLLILLVLTTCTCSGLKLMWGTQTLENQTDYSIYSGRLARQIQDATDCATLRIDAQASLSWLHRTPLTRQQYREMQGLVSLVNQELMRRRCSPIRWYPSQSTILSFSNQYRTEWNAPRRSYRIKSRRRDSLVTPLRRQPRISRPVSIPRSTGRTRATTHMTERNLNSSSTTNQANGRGRTTSSTTGVSRRQR